MALRLVWRPSDFSNISSQA